MKGRRDEDSGSPFNKLPYGSSKTKYYYGHNESGGGGMAIPLKLTMNDALKYLKEVKVILKDQKKFSLFLEVMKNYNSQRTNIVGVTTKVKELFKGHNSLIYGFNAFLPKDHEIILDEDMAPPPPPPPPPPSTKLAPEIEDAINFVDKVKKRFQNDGHVYKSFLDVLLKYRYRKERKGIDHEIAALFQDHPDLVEEFTRFSPNSSPPPNLSNSHMDEDPSFNSDTETVNPSIGLSSISSSLLFAISSLSIS